MLRILAPPSDPQLTMAMGALKSTSKAYRAYVARLAFSKDRERRPNDLSPAPLSFPRITLRLCVALRTPVLGVAHGAHPQIRYGSGALER